MACFLVPLGEAVLASVVKHTAFSKSAADTVKAAETKSVWKKRISALEQMLYGGSFFLAIEHVYHGELVFYPPFLTAMESPEETRVMLHEIATAGSGMALFVTALWGIFSMFGAKKMPGKLKVAARVLAGTAAMFLVDGLFAAFA